jgi:hypothetical protein
MFLHMRPPSLTKFCKTVQPFCRKVQPFCKMGAFSTMEKLRVYHSAEWGSILQNGSPFCRSVNMATFLHAERYTHSAEWSAVPLNLYLGANIYTAVPPRNSSQAQGQCRRQLPPSARPGHHGGHAPIAGAVDHSTVPFRSTTYVPRTHNRARRRVPHEICTYVWASPGQHVGRRACSVVIVGVARTCHQTGRSSSFIYRLPQISVQLIINLVLLQHTYPA